MPAPVSPEEYENLLLSTLIAANNMRIRAREAGAGDYRLVSFSANAVLAFPDGRLLIVSKTESDPKAATVAIIAEGPTTIAEDTKDVSARVVQNSGETITGQTVSTSTS